MKTYAEQEKATPFDWNKALNNSNISEDDWLHMEDLASSWVTCACGNQCDIIPRDSFGEPKDTKLSVLGIWFVDEIYNRDIEKAKETLIDIENRSKELIEKIQLENGKQLVNL